MKFCKDCKHYEQARNGFYPNCVHPDNPGAVDVVSGNRIFTVNTCATVRQDTRRCGPLGDWFTPATLDGKLDMLEEEKSRTVYLIWGDGSFPKAYAFRSAAEKRLEKGQNLLPIDLWEKQ